MLLIENEGRIWLKYKGSSGNDRYVCAVDKDGSEFIKVASNVPGPRKLGGSGNRSSGGNSVTGVFQSNLNLTTLLLENGVVAFCALALKEG